MDCSNYDSDESAEESDEKKGNIKTAEYDSDYVPETDSDNETCKNSKVRTFIIEVSQTIWDNIKPELRTYVDDSSKIKLKKHKWTNPMAQLIWDVAKLKCPLSFKDNIIYKKSKDIYLKFWGSCKECPNEVTGYLKEAPTSFPFKIEIVASDVESSQKKHKKYRHVNFDRREDIKKDSVNVKPDHRLATETNKQMSHSDPRCPLLWSKQAGQQMRQEGINEQLNLKQFPGPPLKSLFLMSKDKRTGIRHFSISPFIVIYWLDEQFKLWKEVTEKLDPSSIWTSVDASGGFFLPVNIVRNELRTSQAMFKYIIVIRFLGSVIPVCQMIADAHDTSKLCDFFKLAKALGAPTPLTMYVDCSSALLNAMSLAYNGMSYKTYLATCFDIIQNVKTAQRPETYIRRDKSHLMKNVTHWNCYEGDHKELCKTFYARCVGFCLEIEDFGTLIEVLKCILIICQSESEAEDTKCFEKLDIMFKLIETFKYDETPKESSDEKNTNDFLSSEDHLTWFEEALDEADEPKNISDYLNKINEECSQEAKVLSAEDFPSQNRFKCPKLVKNILQLFSQFPAWCNVMIKYYKITQITATSTGSEWYFGYIKNILEFNKAITVNRHILKHLPFINAAVKLARAELRQEEIDVVSVAEESLKESSLIVNEEYHETLNETSFYTMKDKCTSKVPVVSRVSPHGVYPLIINGSRCGPVIMNGKQYKVTNTCPFDSIAELFVACYQNESFKNFLNSFIEDLDNEYKFLNCIKNFCESELEDNQKLDFMYLKRAEIMSKIVGVKECTINCYMGVQRLFQTLLTNFKEIEEVIVCSNLNCKYINKLKNNFLSLNEWNVMEPDSFTNSLNQVLQQKRSCRKCGADNLKVTFSFGEYIAFDVEHIFSCAITHGNESNDDICSLIKSLPVKLDVQGKPYKLVGVLAFRPGHFWTCLRKSLSWEIRDGMKTSIETVPLNEIKTYFSFVMYIKS